MRLAGTVVVGPLSESSLGFLQGSVCLPAGLCWCTVCTSQAGAVRRRSSKLRKALSVSMLLIVPETLIEPRQGELM